MHVYIQQVPFSMWLQVVFKNVGLTILQHLSIKLHFDLVECRKVNTNYKLHVVSNVVSVGRKSKYCISHSEAHVCFIGQTCCQIGQTYIITYQHPHNTCVTMN